MPEASVVDQAVNRRSAGDLQPSASSGSDRKSNNERAASRAKAERGKQIPRMFVFPREISLDHLVRRAIQGFESYGDVFQFALPLPLRIFCLRKPDHIKAVTALKECGTIKPPGIIPKADFFMGNGVYNDLGRSSWMAKRRSLAPAFTEAMAQRCSELLPNSFANLASRWAKTGNSTMNFYLEVQRLVLDFAASALFSERLTADQLDWIVAATNIAETMFVSATPHWVPTPANLKFQAIKHSYDKLMDSIMAKHRQTQDRNIDMVSGLMARANPLTNRPYTDDEIRAEMYSAYLGTPAMALTILWGTFVLFTRPEFLAKLRKELKDVTNDRPPGAGDLARLSYLEMFVKEVLRLYPSFWGSLRYARDPIQFEGYEFPPRSIFAMIRFAAQRLPEHWENPNEFVPERHAKRNDCPHAFLPFGLGPRMCLGRSLALTVCPLAIALIAQKFDLHFESDQVAFKYGFGMYPARPMLAKVRPASA